AFLRPKAKIKEGIFLSSEDSVTAMMDISDGLLTDLKKLCKASDVSAEIDVENFKDNIPLDISLTGGEDYSLLITVSSDQYEQLIIKSDFSIQKIGRIIKANPGEVIFKQNLYLNLKEFSHFGEL
ncbi:MAG: hypothetical protein B7Z05_08870, partial [Thiotrichales bacterium 32-46-8]